jgi:hypothetical protein
MTMTDFCLLSFGVVLPLGFFIGMSFNEWTRSRLEHKARVRAEEEREKMLANANFDQMKRTVDEIKHEMRCMNAKLYSLLEEKEKNKPQKLK